MNYLELISKRPSDHIIKAIDTKELSTESHRRWMDSYKDYLNGISLSSAMRIGRFRDSMQNYVRKILRTLPELAYERRLLVVSNPQAEDAPPLMLYYCQHSEQFWFNPYVFLIPQKSIKPDDVIEIDIESYGVKEPTLKQARKASDAFTYLI